MTRYIRVEPYPDEELGSLLTRSMRRTGQGAADFVYWHLQQPKGPFTTIGNLVPYVAELIGSTPRRVLHEHTLVPYGTAGLPPHESRRLTIDLVSGRIPELLRPIGKLGRRWCDICVRHDLAQFGESYWHRCHLLPGVATCALHGTPLIQLSGRTISQPIHRTASFWLDAPLPHELVGTPVSLATAPSLLREISRLSARALSGRRALPRLELTPANWRAVFGPELLHYMGCRGSSAHRMPQTTALILSIIAHRHLETTRAGTQLELGLQC